VGDVPGGDGHAAGAAAGGVAGGQGHEPPAAGARLGRQPRNLRHPQRRPLVSDRHPLSPSLAILMSFSLVGSARRRGCQVACFVWGISKRGWGSAFVGTNGGARLCKFRCLAARTARGVPLVGVLVWGR